MPGALRHVRAVLFDLDGTLVDSLDDITDHLNAALAEVGLPLQDRARVRDWVGHGAAQLVARAVGEESAPAVLARFRARYGAAPVVRTRLYDGLAAALDVIGAGGRRLAVISNKPHELTAHIAAQLLARWRFDAVVGHRPGAPLKPDPEAVLAIARELAVEAAACVMVGDSEVDIATARAAAMPSVAVTWGLRDAATLAAAGPDHVVDTPDELAALFA